MTKLQQLKHTAIGINQKSLAGNDPCNFIIPGCISPNLPAQL